MIASPEDIDLDIADVSEDKHIDDKQEMVILTFLSSFNGNFLSKIIVLYS